MIIRPIKEDDLSAIVLLLHEFAAFEGLEKYCEITVERLAAAMFGENAVVEGLISISGDEPVGYALFYPNFASFRGQLGLYLEDLYVKPEYRDKGLGKAFLVEIAHIAASRGFERIDFLVLDWNKNAIRFYEKLGAVRDADERHFKLTDDVFKILAS
jgi:ribosomal protein S18 acetylase RimI-like enzyme